MHLKTFRFSYDLTILTTLRVLNVIKGTEKKFNKKKNLAIVAGTVLVLLVSRVDMNIIGNVAY